ncbi:MAG TPA: hypothetical protein EYG00_08470 [Alcanivorax sp.]|nr:hypothetical protein [Alcanivorax sp.]
MPVAKLSITLRNADVNIARLRKHAIEAQELAPRFQHFVAEMIMLRLFSIYESGISEIAYKLVSGACYLNGRYPNLSIKSGAVSASRGILLTHDRPRAVQNLKWTKASFVKDSVKRVIPESEKFVFNTQANGPIIDEMRRIRNVLAHQTSSAKRDYRQILRQAYGANVQVPPGAFLTSTRRSNSSKIQTYLTSTSIILLDAASGI